MVDCVYTDIGPNQHVVSDCDRSVIHQEAVIVDSHIAPDLYVVAKLDMQSGKQEHVIADFIKKL